MESTFSLFGMNEHQRMIRESVFALLAIAIAEPHGGFGGGQHQNARRARRGPIHYVGNPGRRVGNDPFDRLRRVSLGRALTVHARAATTAAGLRKFNTFPPPVVAFV
jgi:hypothetical protein